MRLRVLAATAFALAMLGAISGCGSDDVASDPVPTVSGPTASSPSVPASDDGYGPVQLRVVTATDDSPPADSLAKQRFDGLDCSAPAPAVPEQPTEACDAQGVKYLLDPAAIVGGVTSAQALSDQQSGWLIDVRLDADDAQALERVTSALIDTQGQFAILLDGRVLSAPTVSGVVTGELQITGDFTEAQATTLADDLQASS